MSTPFLFIALLIGSTLTLLTLPSRANHPHEIQVNSATNRDGSALRVRTLTSETSQTRKTTIFFRSSQTSQMKPVTGISRSTQISPAAGLVHIIDWDKDGIHEVQVIDECGAGPDCSGTIYRLQPQTGQLITFFRTAGTDVQLIQGYLVQTSRNNCCSWIAAVHPLSKDRKQVSTKALFSVYRGLPPDGDMAKKSQTICYLFREDALGRETRIQSPSKQMLRFCSF